MSRQAVEGGESAHDRSLRPQVAYLMLYPLKPDEDG